MLEPISGPKVAGRVSDVARSVGDLALDATTIVVVSPHGEGRGVYSDTRGDLDGFGRRGASIAARVDTELATAIRAEWDAPRLEPPADHGIVTPLALGLGAGANVVAASVPDAKEGIAFADALRAVIDRQATRVALVASAHLSAALTPRAPIPLRTEAVALEDEIVDGITRDVAILVERAEDLAMLGGSSGAGPLAAIGHCFAGHAAEVAAYSRTYGVGYLVARVDV